MDIGGFCWHCEPAAWSFDSDSSTLTVRPGRETDFWQRTHYGFEADNGHFLYTPMAADFRMSARVAFAPVHQYDQAGLMVRLSPGCWLKTSIEFEPEPMNRLGVVVTNSGYSDWSTQEVPKSITDFRLRVSRKGGDYTVEACWEGDAWTQLRLAHLLEDSGTQPVLCGVYACCPKQEGLVATFSELEIEGLLL